MVLAPEGRKSDDTKSTSRIRTRDIGSPMRTAFTVRMLRSQLMAAHESPDTRPVAEAVLGKVEQADKHRRGLSQSSRRLYWTLVAAVVSLAALAAWLVMEIFF